MLAGCQAMRRHQVEPAGLARSNLNALAQACSLTCQGRTAGGQRAVALLQAIGGDNVGAPKAGGAPAQVGGVIRRGGAQRRPAPPPNRTTAAANGTATPCCCAVKCAVQGGPGSGRSAPDVALGAGPVAGGWPGSIHSAGMRLPMPSTAALRRPLLLLLLFGGQCRRSQFREWSARRVCWEAEAGGSGRGQANKHGDGQGSERAVITAGQLVLATPSSHYPQPQPHPTAPPACGEIVGSMRRTGGVCNAGEARAGPTALSHTASAASAKLSAAADTAQGCCCCCCVYRYACLYNCCCTCC